MRALAGFATLVVAAIAALFAVNNLKPIELDFWPLPDTVSAPLWLVLYAGIAAGLLIGRVSLWPRHLRLKSELRRQSKRLAVAQKDLESRAPDRSLAA